MFQHHGQLLGGPAATDHTPKPLSTLAPTILSFPVFSFPLTSLPNCMCFYPRSGSDFLTCFSFASSPDLHDPVLCILESPHKQRLWAKSQVFSVSKKQWEGACRSETGKGRQPIKGTKWSQVPLRATRAESRWRSSVEMFLRVIPLEEPGGWGHLLINSFQSLVESYSCSVNSQALACVKAEQAPAKSNSLRLLELIPASSSKVRLQGCE